MQKTVKWKRTLQMDLFEGESEASGPSLQGIDVYFSANGRVSQQWISDCEKERVLTKRLMEEIASVGNLEKASRQVIKNKGTPGVDGTTTQELKVWLSKHWRDLQQELLNGTYQPSLVKGVKIPKAKGGTRQPGIPTVKDRLVQQAIHQVLTARYEAIFSDHSYGFRPNRSAHQAVHQSGKYIKEGRKWVVDIDLEKFFDKVDHNRTLWLLSRRVGDTRLLKLIYKFLKAGMLAGGLTSQRVSGTPQGGPLSPLLSNIILDELDKELERRGHRFTRYADDLRIYLLSESSARRVMASITLFIEKRMKLKVNRSKSKVCESHKTAFLGYGFLLDGSLRLSDESERRLKQKIRQITRRNRGRSLVKVITELNTAIQGWLNYFRYAQMKRRLKQLQSWIHRRLRCYRLKQCKRAIGIYRFVRRQGVPKKRCWLLAGSSKGWWRLSGSPVANEAMNNRWFKELGLYILPENYQRLKFAETAVYVSTHGGVRGR